MMVGSILHTMYVKYVLIILSQLQVINSAKEHYKPCQSPDNCYVGVIQASCAECADEKDEVQHLPS
jgi:hypothetical protein